MKYVSSLIVLLALVSCWIHSAAAQPSPNPELGQLPVVAPADVGMSAAKLANVDEAMSGSIRSERIAGGVVMIARHGKVVHFKSYGKMDLAANKPMLNDTIMRIFSMTKPMTTTAAMMLYEEGKLDLDDLVSQYIPQLQNPRVAIGKNTVVARNTMTIRDLMRHTAGYSYGDSQQTAHNVAFKNLRMLDTHEPLEEWSRKLERLPLIFESGTDWGYGISIDVLGRVVEVASDKPLNEFLRQRIFLPLGMNDTDFFVPREKMDRFAANFHCDVRANGDGKLMLLDDPAKSRYRFEPPFFGGGAGLVSTAEDYMKFLMMIASGGELLGKRLLKTSTVDLMTSNQVPKQIGWIKLGGYLRAGVGFGFGFSVRVESSRWDPHSRIGEYGWGGYASTHCWVSPADDLVVVTLEQVVPYSVLTERKLKGIIYDAVAD